MIINSIKKDENINISQCKAELEELKMMQQAISNTLVSYGRCLGNYEYIIYKTQRTEFSKIKYFVFNRSYTGEYCFFSRYKPNKDDLLMFDSVPISARSIGLSVKLALNFLKSEIEEREQQIAYFE